MELQVSIIDGKLIPERYQSAMALTDSEKRIFGILGRFSDIIIYPGHAGYSIKKGPQTWLTKNDQRTTLN
jgi:hypothetical protein